MTVTELPGEIVTSTRDKEIERFKRSFRLRVPDADTGDGSQVDIDARVTADMLMPLYAAAKIAGENAVLEKARGAALTQWGNREGVGNANEARGATGLVKIQASAGGGTIQAGEELRNKDTGLRYEVITTDHYDNEDACGIVGKDKGPATNLPPGTQLQWTSAPPGIGDFVTVLADSSGRGLSGGADKESDDDYYARIAYEKQNRAASGNDSDYQQAAEATPDAPVQKCFTHPAITGSGVTAVVCTMRPEHPGGSRAPSSLQMGLVELHVTGQFPADDGPMYCLIEEEPADVVYSITPSEGAAGFEDVVTWPPYYASSPVSGPAQIRVSAATNATSFTLATANGNYTGVQQPVAGQTIGFYDTAEFTFRRKRILSFTGTGPWVITCDTTNNASDTGYTPAVGQPAMPWWDDADSTLFTAGSPADGTREAIPDSGILAYFDTLGPGEQVSIFYDEGVRQRRQPRPPKSWPSEITRKGLIEAITADTVQDVDALEGDGLKPSVGTPGVLSKILKLRWLALFPES